MFDRDKITESFGKESLGLPMKIVVLVSSAHIPMRARGIVRSRLGNQEVLDVSKNDIPIPHIVITDIIVRELGFLSGWKNNKSSEDIQAIHREPSPLTGLQLRLEAESARAKLTYVREFYTLGAMARLRKSKPDLIIDISDGAEVHEIVLEHSRLGVITVGSSTNIVSAIQRTSSGSNTLIERPYTADTKTQAERTVLLESIMLLSSPNTITN
jgi:hypothetical protein